VKEKLQASTGRKKTSIQKSKQTNIQMKMRSNKNYITQVIIIIIIIIIIK
jgi:hypothetical protein